MKRSLMQCCFGATRNNFSSFKCNEAAKVAFGSKMNGFHKKITFCLAMLAVPLAGNVQAQQASVWDLASKISGLPKGIIYGIAMQESRYRYADGVSRPYPWTLNINGNPPTPLRFSTKEDASRKLVSLIEAGVTNIDVGAMQVNYRYHGHSVARPEHLLDPKTNLMVAAVILSEHMKRNKGDQAKAIADYHSRSPVIGVKYAQNVYSLVDLNRAQLKRIGGS